MKLMKKSVQFMIMAVFLLSFLNLGSAHAATSTQQISIGSSAGKAGESVEVPIIIQSNGTVSALQYKVAYDTEMFELVEMKKGSGLQSAFSMISNRENGKVVIGSLGYNIGAGTKEVAIAVFKIKENAVPDSYAVKLEDVLFSDSGANNLSNQFQVLPGVLTVYNPDFVYVTGITINSVTLNLTVGGATRVIAATITPAKATNKSVTWSSSNTNIATVVNGVVSPVGVGTATITATTMDGSLTATSFVSVQAGNNGGPTQPGIPAQPETQTTNVDIIVNGIVESAGTATTTTVNHQLVTTITVDSQKLEQRLATEANGAVITIPISNDSDVIIGEMNGQMIKSMEQKQATIEIRTDRATYALPAQQINIQTMAEQFGENVKLENIKVQIEIATPTADMLRIIEDASLNGEFTLVVPPLHFTIRATYGSATFDVNKFNAYVERTIAIPDGVDPNKITTGAVVEPDGTIRHVPTKIVLIDGKYYAKVKSLTNSTYIIIYHPIEFQDATNHWAKDVINDMGSRMVISGVGNEKFDPNREITRAEFAAIMIRGLGLKLEIGASSFSDVKETDWYSSAVQTAFAYKLIDGFEDGTFRPLDKITREQAMVMIARAMMITGLKAKLPSMPMEQILSPFADASDASKWAKSSVADSIQAGIVSGRNNTQLAPKANITRAEVAAIVQKLLQKSGLI